MKKFLLFLFITTTAVPLFSRILFSDLDLSSENQLLFRISSYAPEQGSYLTLFSADLDDENTLVQMTYYPERALYLSETNQLQLVNRFGMFRSDNLLTGMNPVEDFPSFLSGDYVYSGKILPFSASPDGRFVVYARQDTATRVSLVLSDIRSGEETLISSGVELSFQELPVEWSDDSRFLVYSKEGKLYYYAIDQLEQQRIIAENYRYLVDGTCRSVLWNGTNLFFAYENFIYYVNSSEFFTRSLYGGVFSPGAIAGKLPFDFDVNTDRFWISPGGSQILLCRGERNLFLNYLTVSDYDIEAESLPYLLLPGEARVRKVVWTASGSVVVLTGNAFSEISGNNTFRLIVEEKGSYFDSTGENSVRDIVLSPDQTQIAVLTEDRILLKNPDTWVTRNSFSYTEPLSAFWKEDGSLIVTGTGESQVVVLEEDGVSRRTICYSQPGEAGFSVLTNNPMMQKNSEVVEYVLGQWVEQEQYSVMDSRTFSSSYRVFLESTPAAYYRNKVMVRRIDGYGTYPLIDRVNPSLEAFPDVEETPLDQSVFTHGSRIRSREVALVFDAALSADGMTAILNTLSEYDIRATFFISGDFIERFPGAVREISEAGHETASLFNLFFDMEDPRYRIDTEFLIRGLARNEDSFYRITGEELTPLWHAPYYYVDENVLEASRRMNYRCIGHDVEVNDWISYYTDGYSSSIEIIESILEQKKPGSIIPMRVGADGGYREDYLYQHLDVLINNLIESGYSFATVSEVIEHSY